VATDFVKRSEASRVQDCNKVMEEALSECSRRMRIECTTYAAQVDEVGVWEMIADVT
jgi:hypothetical protein